MDFPGGSVTNIRVIDGFSNIYWRIYTEEPNIANLPGETQANGYTILKHLSRLKDLELRLRNLDCLASSYPRRLGLWVFSATPDFENLSPLCSIEGKDDQSRLYVGTSTLKVSASGSITSWEIVKNLSADPQPASGGSTGSQRSQNTPAPRRAEGASSYVAIYASFITAVTGALNLQLIRRNNAIPLGSRTLFTVVERESYDAPRVVGKDSSSAPALTTLQVQLTSAGKLTVSLQTISQPGITQLFKLGDSPANIHTVPAGTDLWLSPGGSIARLVNTSPGPSNPLSPYPASGGGIGNDGLNFADSKQWKTNVLEWLKNFGLSMNSTDDTTWVEVEVWEPFYSRLAGEIWRPNDESSSTLPLKRILWPAVCCFRRVKFRNFEPLQNASLPAADPLDFAQSWRGMELPKYAEASPKPPPSTLQEQREKDHEMMPTANDLPETIESLSRASQYPELQSASLVYPTPPDGATTMGLNPRVPSDAFADDSDLGLSFAQNQAKQRADDPFSKNRSDPDVPMGFGPSAGLVVGSGLYDTNDDDDDLFGDMNERDFGTKGITDADFSFFDDPGFSHMGGGAPNDIMQEMSDLMDTTEPEAPPTFTENTSPVVFSTQKSPAPQVDIPDISPAADDTPKPQHNELAAENNEIEPSPRSEHNQIISPPLSPVEIKKILLPGSGEDTQPSTGKSQMQSYYNPVAFKQNMSSWDEKYGAEGKFWFTVTDTSAAGERTSSIGDIPTIGLPRRNRKLSTTGGVSKTVDENGSPPSDDEQMLNSDSDSSSDSGDESDSASLESGTSPATFSTRKRKRARSNSGSSQALTLDKPSGDLDRNVSVYKPEHSTFLGNFLSTFSDWSLTGFFSFSENQLFPVLTRRDLHVQIAQLLVDQVTQSSLDHKLDGLSGLSDLEDGAYSIRTFLEDMAFMGGIERLDLNSFVSLQDSHSSPPPANGAASRQSSQRREAAKGSISKLSPPHLRVRRGKEYLEALPPAVSFWETFGLEPAHGPKDISAYCIHPHIAADAADAFLERLGLVYSSCNLGSHVRGDKSLKFDRGLGAWDIGSSEASNYPSVMQSLRIICEELGTTLSNIPSSKDNIVIYIINPFTNTAAMVDICSAFWSLFQKYLADGDKQQSRKLNEIVLQIVPMDFVTSAESLIVPPQTQYLSLALEVYSRCPPQSAQSSLVDCAPPMLLAEPLPRTLNFKLASEKSSPLQEGKCLHIACSRSQDQRWISVAWSDNTGSLQRTMSYNLRFRGANASRSVYDVRTEIWGATKDIMDRIQARWRIMLVNTEAVDQDEVDTWSNFAEHYNRMNPIPLELTILNVNAIPDLYLEPPVLPIPMSVFNAQASNTPVATPNPSVLSPDQVGNAPTPPGGGNIPANAPTPTEASLEAEAESLLTDICDESWGAILSHRLNSSPHLTEYRPALASGYLLRRKGATDGDGTYAMTINIIHAQRHPSAYESLLRETLGMYRDLATLARAKGTRTVQRSTLPWHIATAIGAQEVLSYVL